MALENLTGPDVFITNLVQANPTVTDPVSQGDDHLRGIKNVLLNSFPNINAPLTVSSADINGFAPLASPAFTGVPTAPTAAAGTDTTQLATTAFVKAAVAAAPGIGTGQTWQDVSGSRAQNTPYTNSTTAPIMVSIYPQEGTSDVTLSVAGLVVATAPRNGANGTRRSMVSTIVPVGAVYQFNSNNAAAYWRELRGA